MIWDFTRTKIWLNWHRIDLFGGKGANKRCANFCTGSDGATDDDAPSTVSIFCTCYFIKWLFNGFLLLCHVTSTLRFSCVICTISIAKPFRGNLKEKLYYNDIEMSACSISAHLGTISKWNQFSLPKVIQKIFKKNPWSFRYGIVSNCNFCSC